MRCRPSSVCASLQYFETSCRGQALTTLSFCAQASIASYSASGCASTRALDTCPT